MEKIRAAQTAHQQKMLNINVLRPQ